MALSQFGFARKAGEEDVELMYWRRHADLESLVRYLYYNRMNENSKGRWSATNLENFNNIEVELHVGTLSLFERLMGMFEGRLQESEEPYWYGPYMRKCKPPHWYGRSTEAHSRDTKLFIEKAREYLKNGWQIFYRCSW